MDDNVIENTLIDPNISSYAQFFDHEWAKGLFERVRMSPLKEAVESLMVAWRATNGSHRLPWLMVHSLKSFAEGEHNGTSRFRATYAGSIVKSLADKIQDRMQYSLDRKQRAALKRVVERIEKEGYEALKIAQSQVDIDVAGYWDFLTHASEFQFCILGTQRINYGSLFFAYEDFMANTIRSREPAYTSRNSPIRSAFAKHFGAVLTDYCWNHEEVDLAKLVRNALVHNDGRLGADLGKYGARFVDATGTTNPSLQGHVFVLVDGKIRITPRNTTHLFGVLKDRVTRIVEELA